ncbi:hypothetical protein, partial [Pseudomonas sp. RGM 3321]|uniref:hypothetical protein n=1 Tax=Pseudomonas sp. RGM 3321 TaxID=2930089 RepID=UPI001FCB3417
NDELADIKLEGCIEFSVFLGHGDSSMDIVSPIKVSGVIRPAHSAFANKFAPTGYPRAFVGAHLFAKRAVQSMHFLRQE